MSVRRSPENSSRLAIESVQCSVCNDTNAEIEFVETPCQHRFHRTCVTSWLLQNETCPNCRQPCLSSQLNDSTRRAQDTTLEVPRVQNGSNPNSRTGAVPRSRPNTRPTTRSTATISNNRPSTSSQPQRSPRAGGSQRTTSISEGRIQELITNALEAYQTQLSSTLSEQISLAMQNLHIPTSQRQSLEWDVELPPADPLQSQPFDSHLSGNHNISANRSLENRRENHTIRPDQISSLIVHWKLQFSGSPKDIFVDDFIYRVNTLTRRSLNGNFDLLYEYANLLFVGPALTFFWRCHRSSEEMNWRLLCSRLRERYKDQRSDQDIRAAMRRRRQGNSECFDDFLDSILAIADALSEPISDSELAQTIRNNLRSDQGHDLLHIETPTIAALRKHCHRHEEFFNNLRAKSSSRPR
ncbi:uncharacterized protein LOC123258005 [Drosophila ananassae]|uniref:uncharacterized protein LOC123258005 n=1 Tax=Drosophila ananassae TaxID=7217 RepID=UPI001CFF5C92|nr:uncharacterized protein LOC123258005 [Drosophila ananassae]